MQRSRHNLDPNTNVCNTNDDVKFRFNSGTLTLKRNSLRSKRAKSKKPNVVLELRSDYRIVSKKKNRKSFDSDAMC